MGGYSITRPLRDKNKQTQILDPIYRSILDPPDSGIFQNETIFIFLTFTYQSYLEMSRNWCITVNVDMETEYDALNPELWPNCRYFVWQLELASTGQVHYQCFLQTFDAVRMTSIKKYDGLERAHIEKKSPNSTAEQARDYCKKADSRLDGPWEFGDFTSQGNRTDVASFVDAVKQGKSDRDLIETMPGSFVRFNRSIERIRLAYAQPRNFKTRVYFFYGQPGNGKSKLAAELLENAFWKQPHSIWWDGYFTGDVIIDDFKGWLPYADLLRLMDRYPLQVQIKGGQVNFAPKNLVITSSVIPQNWYSPDKVRFNWEEFSRRVDVFIHFPAKDVCEEIDAAKFYELYVFNCHQ